MSHIKFPEVVATGNSGDTTKIVYSPHNVVLEKVRSKSLFGMELNETIPAKENAAEGKVVPLKREVIESFLDRIYRRTKWMQSPRSMICRRELVISGTSLFPIFKKLLPRGKELLFALSGFQRCSLRLKQTIRGSSGKQRPPGLDHWEDLREGDRLEFIDKKELNPWSVSGLAHEVL
ncbi:hypothetical protein SCHPADRAFT_888762 [Schizopora paradoxa]|uniref:Uncharacterized protein n=1 Tax=Schizopora paradoxa TaxID=27342 RepID=A0A0H2S070_9AGAM|nr:hypothetical protein SCHPADRAFT_888762 [Schizopora paradoxa]